MKLQKGALGIWHSHKSKQRLAQLPNKQLIALWFDAIANHDFKKMKAIFSTQQLLIDAVNESGWTALMYAARNNDVIMATWLLQQGADINFMHQQINYADCSYTPAYGSAFQVACAQGSLQVAQLLYATGSVDQQKINTAFLGAFNYRGYKMVSWLMSIGIDLNTKDAQGRSAFLIACRRSTLEIVQRLFATGNFTVDVIDNDGNNALIHAIDLLGNNRSKSLDMQARYIHQPQIVAWLIEQGIDVNHKNNLGISAFMIAAGRKNGQILDLLHGTGKIDINEQDHQGHTALMYAISHNADNLEKLLGWGADITLRNNKGQTALDDAVEEWQTYCKQYDCKTTKSIVEMLQQAEKSR